MSYSLKSNVAFAVLLGLIFLGCNNATGRPLDPGKPIVLQFHYNGVPISEGAVDLSGMGGGTTLTSTGEAIFEHVPFGTYQVVVHPKNELGDAIPPTTPSERPSAKQPQTRVANIPRKFRDEQTTPLQIDVQEGGTDRFEFDLMQ